MKVYTSSTKESAGMGGALLAKFARWKLDQGGIGSFESMSGDKVGGLECVAKPVEAVSQTYENLVSIYDSCEEYTVANFV